jgi:hypothetical protein
MIEIAVTCKRGSAKHCVKDDFAFLCKHTSFGHPQIRESSTGRNKTRHSWQHYPKDPSVKIVADGGFSTNGWYITLFAWACLFFFFSATHLPSRPNVRPMHIINQLIWFELRMCFLGSNQKKFIWGVIPKPLFCGGNRDFQLKCRVEELQNGLTDFSHP